MEFNEGLQSIGERSFNYIGLAAVTFPRSLNTIERCAFSGCRELEAAEFAPGSQLRQIYTSTFMCTPLERGRLELPVGAHAIGQ